MSLSRLQKNICKATTSSDNSQTDLAWKPVIISDSKGRYIKLAVNKSVSHENEIIWCFKSGANCHERYIWLEHNVEDLLKKHRRIALFIWLGTCDLTRKVNKYINLKPNPVANLKNDLQKYKDLADKYSNVKICFIHVPYYSIEKWNKLKGHSNSETFKEDDRRLTDYITEINNFIDDLNCQTGTSSPRLNQDLCRSRKRKNSKARYSWNFNLLVDGIHPSSVLAKSWLKSICRTILRDCL